MVVLPSFGYKNILLYPKFPVKKAYKPICEFVRLCTPFYLICFLIFFISKQKL